MKHIIGISHLKFDIVKQKREYDVFLTALEAVQKLNYLSYL
jgi:hypothetical protein